MKLMVKEDYKHTRKYNILIKHLIIIPRNKDQVSVRHIQFVIMYGSLFQNLASVNVTQFRVLLNIPKRIFLIFWIRKKWLMTTKGRLYQLKEMSDITECKTEIIIRIMKARQRSRAGLLRRL